MYRTALACVIVVGSLIFWMGIPLFWIWIAGKLTEEYPSIYLLAAAACPLTMIAWGWILYRVNLIYTDLAPPHRDAPGTQRSAWLGSLSDNRRRKRPEPTLLDVSMVVSVIIALTALAVWFFVFAHSSGPLPD